MTKSEESAVLRRIKLAGIPIEPDVEARLDKGNLRIESLGNSVANRVIDIRRGGTIYQSYLRVTCDILGPIFIKGVQLAAPWEESVELLSDPLDGSGNPYYRLRNGDSFEHGRCLNHLLFSSTALRRGNCIEGFLLAEGIGQVPSSFPERSRVKALFTIVDQFSEMYSAELELAVERIEMPKARHRRGTESLPHATAQREFETAVPAGDSKRSSLYSR